MIVRRYMHLSGATNADFGVVWVADRYHGAVKPKAHFYGKPIRLEDHQNSRWIAEPLRLPEWCHDTDGAVTIVVTWLERARDLPNRPVIIEAAAHGSSQDQYMMTSYYRPELWGCPRWVWWDANRGRSRAHAGRHPNRRAG